MERKTLVKFDHADHVNYVSTKKHCKGRLSLKVPKKDTKYEVITFIYTKLFTKLLHLSIQKVRNLTNFLCAGLVYIIGIKVT